MLANVPVWLVLPLVAALFYGAASMGFASRSRDVDASSDRAASGIVQTAAFTLLSLLLGFSFSLALARFDARRALVTSEANAIATAILRTSLLAAHDRERERELLHAYARARRDVLARADDDRVRELAERDSTALQTQIWELAIDDVRHGTLSTATPLYLAALNDAFDFATVQRAAARANVPDLIVVLVLGDLALTAFAYGATWRSRRAALRGGIVLALAFGIVVTAIADLGQPRAGTILVDLSTFDGIAPARDAR